MKKKKTPLPTWADLEAALAQARARASLYRDAYRRLTAAAPGAGRDLGGPDRFVQIVAVQLGRASVLHALDTSGQVWQYQYARQSWGPVPMKREEVLTPYIKEEGADGKNTVAAHSDR